MSARRDLPGAGPPHRRRSPRSPALAAALGLGLLVLTAGPAGAHGLLQRADPRAGGTVRTPPGQVRLWFSQRLEAGYSTVKVLDGAGRQVDRGDAGLDPADPALLRGSLPPLPPGAYRVLWRVLSVDGHVTEGEFTFRIAP